LACSGWLPTASILQDQRCKLLNWALSKCLFLRARSTFSNSRARKVVAAGMPLAIAAGARDVEASVGGLGRCGKTGIKTRKIMYSTARCLPPSAFRERRAVSGVAFPAVGGPADSQRKR
jgi:hypothetical protein